MPPSPTATTEVKKPKASGKQKQKAAAPPPPTPEPEPTPPNDVTPEALPQILYPAVKVELWTGKEPITAEVAKRYLDWETEAEYALRLTQANPGLKDSDVYTEADGRVTTFGNAKKYGDSYMLVDDDKAKVRCWNNRWNRDFDEGWSRMLAQSILNGQWAGELTIPETSRGVLHELARPFELPDGSTVQPGEEFEFTEGTINGDGIKVSRTGKIQSGQHTLVAVILANQMWWKNRKKYPFWEDSATGPVIEASVTVGLSDDRRVLMTTDYCRPRSEADCFYTSNITINGVPFNVMPGGERKELARMLAAAVDLLWRRTGTQGYKTNPEAVAFVDRHPKLLKCLEHVYVENLGSAGRKISNLRLSAGQSAAMCYLMGCSGPTTDGDLYRNGFPPSEKSGKLDWSLFGRAKDFWALLGASPDLLHVRAALAALKDGDPDSSGAEGEKLGLGGRLAERMCIVQKAWEVFKGGSNPVPDDLVLTYEPAREETGKDKEGNTITKRVPAKLHDFADFGGVDVPDKQTGGSTAEAPVDPEVVRKAADDELVRRAKETLAKNQAQLAGTGAVAKPVSKPPQPAKK